MITAMEAIVAGFAFEVVIAFSAAKSIVFAVANQGVVAEIPKEGVVTFFAEQGVGKNIALEGVGLAIAGEGAITGGEEAWVDDRAIGDAITIPGWISIDQLQNNGIKFAVSVAVLEGIKKRAGAINEILKAIGGVVEAEIGELSCIEVVEPFG